MEAIWIGELYLQELSLQMFSILDQELPLQKEIVYFFSGEEKGLL